MVKPTEVQKPQNPSEVEVPKTEETPAEITPEVVPQVEPKDPAEVTPVVTVTDPEEVTIPKAELDDLKHKAGVSTQNFERLKKSEEANGLLQTQLSERNNVPADNGETVGKLAGDVSDIQKKLAKSELIKEHPALEEAWKDFETYHAEDVNKGMPLETAAKAFLTEKGLIAPRRKGLEKPTGGTKVPLSPTMSTEEIQNLRQTNYKKYREMVKKGQIKFS